MTLGGDRGSLRLAQAAAAATGLAAIGLLPVIEGGMWAVPVATAVLVVFGVGVGLRALRTPTWAVVLAQLIGLLLVVGALVAGDQARLGFLPSRSWLTALAEAYQLGVETVATYQAPVPLDDGVLMLLAGGVGLVAVAVDVLAVSARMVPLAGVPLAVLHAVAMATTPGGPTVWAFVAVAAGYLILLAVDGRERSRRWGRPLGSPATSVAAGGLMATRLAPIGTPLAIGAVVLAVAGAGLLPQGGLTLLAGAGGSSGSGGQTIRTDNPIVDLRRDLVQPEDVDVIQFTTTASNPEYLRLLTLDVYDGTVWRTSDRPVPEDNRISGGLPNPPGLGPDISRSEEQYTVQITESLESQWLPLPYPASDITTADGDWRYHADTMDVVATDRDTRGLRYDVTSVVVEPTVEQLSGPPAVPARQLDVLDLPDDLPPLVRDLAREVTAESADNYERAADLQRWFRDDGGFVYDLSVDPGNGSDDLVAFLEERRGYCEQFAASMAIMARTLGIPARVAVGYLRGQEEQPGFWVVRAQDAHAWPELFFEGVGWVRFEPTPGSRTGAAPGYTTGQPATTEVPESLQSPLESQTGDDETDRAGLLDATIEQGGAAGSQPSRWPLVGAIGALVMLALTPLLVGVVVRRRRWAAVGSDSRRAAEAAWADVSDAALEVGLTANPQDTVRTTAAALVSAADLPVDARRSLSSVARATERARFAAAPPAVDDLRDDAEQVRRALVRTAPSRVRWQAVVWPAPARRLVARLLRR